MRAAVREAPVFVTLLAGEEGLQAAPAPARESAPPPAEPLPRVEPEVEPAPPPRVTRPAPARRPPAPTPRPAATPTAKLDARAVAPTPSAAAPEGAPAAETGGGAAPARGSTDVARVYGEGEVDRAAAPVGGIRRPEYPARERMMGREGRVLLLVQVDAAGQVRDVTVSHSAGEAFDGAARRAVEGTAFRAARVADRDVASTVTVDVSFELE